jgi:sugar phosphate isomerase/epimerase
MDVRFGASVEEFLALLDELDLDHLELKREYLAGHPDTPTPRALGDLADSYGVTVTYHAPFRDWNLGSFNDASRTAAVEQVKATLDDAATADAGAVVVHGGSVPRRYPAWVRETAAENARRSLAECAAYAAEVGVPLCLENQPPSDSDRRYTTTPDDLAGSLDAVPVDDALGVTLDVGHANLTDYSPADFLDRVGDRVTVCHLHDNDGTADQHHPLTDYERFLDRVPADYFVFETKSPADLVRSVGRDPESVPLPSETP